MIVTDKEYDTIVRELSRLPYKDNITESYTCTRDKQDEWASYLFSYLFDYENHTSTYLPTIVGKFYLPFSDVDSKIGLFLSTFKRVFYRQIFLKFVRSLMREERNLYKESMKEVEGELADILDTIEDEQDDKDDIYQLNINNVIDCIHIHDVKKSNYEFLSKCDSKTADLLLHLLSGTSISKLVDIYYSPSHEVTQNIHNHVRKDFTVNTKYLDKSYSDTYSDKITLQAKTKLTWEKRRKLEKKIDKIKFRLLVWYKLNGVVDEVSYHTIVSSKYKKLNSKVVALINSSGIRNELEVLKKVALQGAII